jgi:hypothetical protein
VGYLDKILAQEAQCEQDELLLYPEKYALITESEVESIDDNDIPLSTGPVAPSPSHERNISVPTPGVCRSIRLQTKDRRGIHLQTKEKEAANLTVQGIVINVVKVLEGHNLNLWGTP